MILTEKDKLITSPSANRMLNYISPVYDNDPYMLQVFEVIGKEIDEVVNWINDIENQPYPQFATFTLSFWEESIGLEVDNKLTTEERQNRIVTRLSTYFPITKQRLEKILSSVSGVPVEIEDFVEPYTFNVVLGFGQVSFKDLVIKTGEVKPAHLSYHITQKLETGFYLPATSVCGEEITVYPWSSTELETKGTINYGNAIRYVEHTSVYPERSV